MSSLAFVTNFVPNIGCVLGLVPPALLALVVGWARPARAASAEPPSLVVTQR